VPTPKPQLLFGSQQLFLVGFALYIFTL